MSQLEIKRLNDQLSKNKSLKAKVDAATTSTELVAIAREAGFDVSADDFQQFARPLESDELDMASLEHVSGGVGSTRPSAAQIAGDDSGDSAQREFASKLRGASSTPASTEQIDGSSRGIPPAFGS